MALRWLFRVKVATQKKGKRRVGGGKKGGHKGEKGVKRVGVVFLCAACDRQRRGEAAMMEPSDERPSPAATVRKGAHQAVPCLYPAG